MAFTVPAAVERLLTADVAVEIARVFGDQPVYPQRIIVDSPDRASPARPGSQRRFPGWPGPVLVLSDENQGVCSWGVPVGDSEQVVVGGDLLEAGHTTVSYAASAADFIAARRWDHRCLDDGPVLQAQATGLDPASLGYLQARLAPAVATAGWPGPRQYRFGDRDVRVMLWSQAGQCDWVDLGGQPGIAPPVRGRPAGSARLAPDAVVQRRRRRTAAQRGARSFVLATTAITLRPASPGEHADDNGRQGTTLRNHSLSVNRRYVRAPACSASLN